MMHIKCGGGDGGGLQGGGRDATRMPFARLTSKSQ